MVFTSADEAKPMLPHKDGGACLCCEATFASQWRGPGSSYCSLSKCKKAAQAAREQMRNAPAAPLKEKVTALEAEVHELQDQVGSLDNRVEEQERRLAEQDELVGVMKRQLNHLTQVCSALQHRSGCERMQDGTASKRPALAVLPPRMQLPP